MGTFDPADLPPTPPQPESEAPANPWAPWEDAGIRPDAYTPDAVRNGAQLWQALSNRDYRDPARAQLLRGDILEDGETMEDLREAMRLRREAMNDPWAQMDAEPEVYYDPRTGQPIQAQAEPAFDPRMLQSAVDQTIQQRLAAYERQQAEQRQQEARQQEFLGELNRRKDKHEWDDYEAQAVAGYAVQAANANPYASTKDLFDIAEKAHDDMLTRRLAGAANRQREVAPRATTPQGPVAAEGAPMSLAEAEQRMMQDFNSR